MTQKKENAAVQTSALPVPAAAAKAGKPQHHQPTQLQAPDEFHGRAGRYVRDPATGERTLRKD